MTWRLEFEIYDLKFEIRKQGKSLDTDRDVNTGRQIELFEFIHGACCWIYDVEQALVCPDFELFSRLFVHVNGTVDAEFFDTSWKRDWAGNTGTRAFGGLHDFLSGAINRAMVEGAQADANFLIFHRWRLFDGLRDDLQGE